MQIRSCHLQIEMVLNIYRQFDFKNEKVGFPHTTLAGCVHWELSLKGTVVFSLIAGFITWNRDAGYLEEAEPREIMASHIPGLRGFC